MTIDKSREHLPYRETTDAFLIYDGKVLTMDKSRYMQFPGGGVDPGETPIQAVKREIQEEVGCKVDKLQLIASIDSDWFPEWADTEKRKKRYQQFRGERTHLFIGFITSFGKPTSDEGDAWPLPIKKHLININNIDKKMTEQIKSENPAFMCYKTNQLSIIRMIKYFKNTLT